MRIQSKTACWAEGAMSAFFCNYFICISLRPGTYRRLRIGRDGYQPIRILRYIVITCTIIRAQVSMITFTADHSEI